MLRKIPLCHKLLLYIILLQKEMLSLLFLNCSVEMYPEVIIFHQCSFPGGSHI